MSVAGDTKDKEKAGDILLMICLGFGALVVIGGVIFVLTQKPKLNDDTEDAGKKAVGPEPTPLPIDNSETDYDPQNRFTMDDAQRAVGGSGGWMATIHTGKGDLSCKLYEQQAPNTVANFIGLATGARAWKDPKKNKWVHRPAYDGTPFHRTIKGFMIQGGDPLGNGTGEPGYVIPDEMWGGRHDRPGLLCMANRGPNTNGAQFFIMDGSAPHIDSSYTIFGDCTPVDVVHDIANQPTTGDRPVNPVIIESVRITRTN